VQGVFFRDTVRRIAGKHEVHGFVRNLGRDILEIEAEGEPGAVNAFIDDVLAHPPHHARVDNVESKAIPVNGEHGFHVR